jgi:hypothetical protein
MTVERPARRSAAWSLRRVVVLSAFMAAACISAACARGGGDDSAPGDDGGTNQDSGAGPDTTVGSTRDSAAHDSMPGEAASGDSSIDAGGDDTSDAGDFDSATDPDTQAGVDSAVDTGPPDTGPGPGMDSGVDTGLDTGTGVHDAGNDTTTNLPSCAKAYDQGDCTSYTTGTSEVSNNSRNWLCLTNCQNCGTTNMCAPGQSSCPWGTVWSDKGACH